MKWRFPQYQLGAKSYVSLFIHVLGHGDHNEQFESVVGIIHRVLNTYCNPFSYSCNSSPISINHFQTQGPVETTYVHARTRTCSRTWHTLMAHPDGGTCTHITKHSHPHPSFHPPPSNTHTHTHTKVRLFFMPTKCLVKSIFLLKFVEIVVF